jgi:putative ABC transport system substrate-binding protein
VPVAHTVNPEIALRNATSTIPIVFCIISDPYGGGLIENIAHPGRNITRFTNMEPVMEGKWSEMPIEIAPRLTHVAVMCNPKTTPTAAAFVAPAEAVARKSGASAFLAPVHRPSEIEPVMMTLKRGTGGGLVLPPGTDPPEQFALTADYIENPGELPVQAPTQFRLVINLKAAEGIGLKAPIISSPRRRDTMG